MKLFKTLWVNWICFALKTLSTKFILVVKTSNKPITSCGHSSSVLLKEETEEKIIRILMVVCGEIEKTKLIT